MKPVVSALVPSYRHAKYLSQRLESIYRQIFTDYEVIVIDDASTDDSHLILSRLQPELGFTYIRNEKNSGTPFAAWEKAISIAKGDFIWICESDDVALDDFLESAVRSMRENPEASLYYCSSEIIDEAGVTVGHTNEYFHEIWKESRWDASFSADGAKELRDFQVRGQTVPNMSSALIRSAAFRNAYRPFLKRLKLTGDWLFIGWLMKTGGVVFDCRVHNRFRRHEQTSRASVDSARSQAEFIITKFCLFRSTEAPSSDMPAFFANDAIRFLYEPAKWYEVLLEMLRISMFRTVSIGVLLGFNVLRQPLFLRRFLDRYRMVRGSGVVT